MNQSARILTALRRQARTHGVPFYRYALGRIRQVVRDPEAAELLRRELRRHLGFPAGRDRRAA